MSASKNCADCTKAKFHFLGFDSAANTTEVVVEGEEPIVVTKTQTSEKTLYTVAYDPYDALQSSIDFGALVTTPSGVQYVENGLPLKGVTVNTMEETTKAIKQSCEDQKKGITTFIEVILNQELGEPFRRDAMKKPVKVAGISKKDMRPQKEAI